MLKKMLTMTTRVSILILMEVSLVRTITGATMNAMTSFNPYFNGSFSCTLFKNNTKIFNRLVSILILMEVSLVLVQPKPIEITVFQG